MLAKKGILHCHTGAIDYGLKFYGEALAVKETQSTWALKGTALLQVDRLDEAFRAFGKAFELRREFGIQQKEYLNGLIVTWSTGALLRGLGGILEQNLSEAQRGVEDFIGVSSTANAEGLTASLVQFVGTDIASTGLKAALEELARTISICAIK